MRSAVSGQRSAVSQMAPIDGLPTPQALWTRLTETQRAILGAVATAATAAGGAAYLVGGPVRDLFITDGGLRDIDVTMTVDARVVAQEIVRTLGRGAVTQMTAFGTATIRVPSAVPEILTLDLATTRTETYAAPGALPTVAFPASIADDLLRRDFTINAMALPLTPQGFGPLVAAPHATDDLHDGVIRVLHDASFRDDSTRLFRSLRYAARYNFALESRTEAAFDLAMAADALATISPARKRHEIELGMLEADGGACLAVFAARGLLIASSPVLQWDAWVAERLTALLPLLHQHRSNTRGVAARESRIVTALWPAWACFVCREGEGAATRLFAAVGPFTANMERDIRRLVRLWQAHDAIAQGMSPSDIDRLAADLPEEIARIIIGGRDPAYAPLTTYYARRAHLVAQNATERRLTGKDLARFGVPPDQRRRNTLGALWAARLDGLLETDEDEIAFVARYVETQQSGK